MKRRKQISNMVSVITGVVGFFAFMCVIGTAGAYEVNAINEAQMVGQLVKAFGTIAGCFLVNGIVKRVVNG